MPWQEAVDCAWFPLVANNGSVIPTRKSVPTIMSLFDEDEIVKHALEVLQGAEIRKNMPSCRLMVKRELSKNGI